MFNLMIYKVNIKMKSGKEVMELSLISLFLVLCFNGLSHEITQPEISSINTLWFDSGFFLHSSHLSAGNVSAAFCHPADGYFPRVRHH